MGIGTPVRDSMVTSTMGFIPCTDHQEGLLGWVEAWIGFLCPGDAAGRTGLPASVEISHHGSVDTQHV